MTNQIFLHPTEVGLSLQVCGNIVDIAKLRWRYFRQTESYKRYELWVVSQYQKRVQPRLHFVSR